MWSDEEILYYVNYMLMCLTLKENYALKSLKVMIEARNFQYAVNTQNGDIHLSFCFSGSGKANQVTVIYCSGMDDFEIVFYKNQKEINRIDHLYFEDLKDIFSQITGLETHLPKIMMATPNISFMRVGDH
ncbi:hypothetical protein [Neisseria sp. Ec49-e6-T10]|uniref:hypothetical protein n=1 Tax=Neisseria sp. Ec49-e6-T10 TaxID=3140744 RepID=UPI003EBDF8B7